MRGAGWAFRQVWVPVWVGMQGGVGDGLEARGVGDRLGMLEDGRNRLGVQGGVGMGVGDDQQGVQARMGSGLEVWVAGRWGRVTGGTAPGYKKA